MSKSDRLFILSLLSKLFLVVGLIFLIRNDKSLFGIFCMIIFVVLTITRAVVSFVCPDEPKPIKLHYTGPTQTRSVSQNNKKIEIYSDFSAKDKTIKSSLRFSKEQVFTYAGQKALLKNLADLIPSASELLKSAEMNSLLNENFSSQVAVRGIAIRADKLFRDIVLHEYIRADWAHKEIEILIDSYMLLDTYAELIGSKKALGILKIKQELARKIYPRLNEVDSIDFDALDHCVKCGRPYAEDDFIFADGNYYCRACFDNIFKKQK